VAAHGSSSVGKLLDRDIDGEWCVTEDFDPWEVERCRLGSPEDMVRAFTLQLPTRSMLSANSRRID